MQIVTVDRGAVVAGEVDTTNSVVGGRTIVEEIGEKNTVVTMETAILAVTGAETEAAIIGVRIMAVATIAKGAAIGNTMTGSVGAATEVTIAYLTDTSMVVPTTTGNGVLLAGIATRTIIVSVVRKEAVVEIVRFGGETALHGRVLRRPLLLRRRRAAAEVVASSHRKLSLF